MLKRVFDLVFSFLGLVLLFPLFVLLIVLIKLSSKGAVFFKQIRVGKDNQDFIIYKFRTMYVGSDQLGLLTVGNNDRRITRIGYYLRKFKLDELPQLVNVLKGDMSFVGPRPEIRKYVNLYNSIQKQVLNVRPGITDLASIAFVNENEILAMQANPDEYYINIIMPRKLEINLEYLSKRTLLKDIQVIIKTFFAIV